MTTANVYRYNNDLDKSKQYYFKALNEYKEIKDVDGVALAYGCILKCFILESINEDSIHYYFEKTLSYKDSIVAKSEIRTIADAHMDYSEFLIHKGEYHFAMDNLIPAINIYNKTKDNIRELYAKQILASIHIHFNNKSKATEILEGIAPKALNLKLYPLYSGILCNLGERYRDKKEYRKAQELYKNALDINLKYNTHESTSEIYNSLSRLNLDFKQIDSALYFANMALSMEKSKYNDPANIQMAKALSERNKFVEAEKYLSGFLNNQLKQEKKTHVLEAYEALYSLYEKWGKYKEACEYHNLYNLLKDSLYSQENANKLADVEAWYWSKQKKNELALSKKNEELKTKEAEEAKTKNELYASQRNALIIGIILVIVFSILLYRINLQRRKNKLMQRVSELELKAIRAQMNPHFLFNALSAIQMLINKNDIKQSNLALAKFGKLMRLILECSEKQTISIEDEIKILKLYIELEALRFPFNYFIDIDPAIDKENVKIPSMIIQPYVENAIKHGISMKPNNRNIVIRFKQHEKQLLCTVEDNGIGREQAEKTKSKYSQHTSMGTKLSQERLEILSKQTSKNAKVTINDLLTEKGIASGTRVELSMPITYNEN